MERKIRLFISLVIVAALLLTGCSGSSEKNGSTSNTTSGSANTASTDTAKTDTAKTDAAATEVLKSTEPVVVRIADNNAWSFARHSGLLDKEFEGENVTFEFSNFANGAARNEAIAAGSIDIAILGTQPALTGIANGYGTKLVAKSNNSEKGGVLVGSTEAGITSFEDLKGKVIGTTIGGGWQYTLLKILEHEGISVDEVEIINTSPDTATAVRGGEVAAGVVGSTQAQSIIKDGDGILLSDGEGYLYDTSWIEASEEFINEHGDILVRILKVLNESYAWRDANKQAAFEGVAEDFQKDYEYVEYSEQYSYWTLIIDQDDINRTQDQLAFLIENDLIVEEISLESAFDLSALSATGLFDAGSISFK